jgi:hypothetical protein
VVNLNCLGTLLLPMIKMHSRKDSHNVDGNTERTDASTHHFQRKRRIPWRYYAIDCLQYASLAFLAGGMFGAVRGFRAMKYSSISNEKINLLREKIFMGSKLSEQLVSNTKSQKRPLEKRHLIIASTIQSGFKYGINSALLIGMFCLIDTSLRARFAWHNVPIVKEWNHALNLALLSTDMMESISDERHLTSHNILHKMVSGSVVGAIIATFVSINTHRKLLKMIGYGIPLGMALYRKPRFVKPHYRSCSDEHVVCDKLGWIFIKVAACAEAKGASTPTEPLDDARSPSCWLHARRRFAEAAAAAAARCWCDTCPGGAVRFASCVSGVARGGYVGTSFDGIRRRGERYDRAVRCVLGGVPGHSDPCCVPDYLVHPVGNSQSRNGSRVG